MRSPSILACLLIAIATPAAQAVDLYVSPSGANTNPGTIDRPWKTFQKAATTAKPGDHVYLRGGTYTELVNITAQGTVAAPIVFSPYGTERVVISGAGLVLSPTASVLIRLANRNYITLDGLILTSLATANADILPMGIHIYTTTGYGSTGVVIRNCEVSSIQQNNSTPFNLDASAYGIAVRGYSTLPIQNLILENNKVHGLRLGASEAISVNGNVSNFLVIRNTVWDCNNIGIDFIGYERLCPTVALDRARSGTCCDNIVYNIDSQYNPAYGGNLAGSYANATSRNATRAAAGIFVDGGDNIIIERNTITRCNFGLELACEHANRLTTNCIARDNVIARNHVGGVVLGGASDANGGTSNCKLINNTLCYNDTTAYGGGAILIQDMISGCTIRNNILLTLPATASYTPQFILWTGSGTTFTDNAIDYNLYAGCAANDCEFIWNGSYKPSFSAWKLTRQDSKSLFIATGLNMLDPAHDNFKILATSPARDKGDPAILPATDEKDIEGLTRQVGKLMDIGAYETR